jgi:hypothetical protein
MEIERLITQQAISNRHPWATFDQHLIEGHLKHACAAVIRATGTKSKVEWEHYGSGYASFVDAWFYKSAPEFNVKRPVQHGEEHIGLIVLLSRLSPYFVFMEGEKHWHVHGGSSYLPEFSMIDRLENQAVALLAQQVQPVLEHQGFIRVHREQLAEALTSKLRVPTVLTDRDFTLFDALFYWED